MYHRTTNPTDEIHLLQDYSRVPQLVPRLRSRNLGRHDV